MIFDILAFDAKDRKTFLLPDFSFLEKKSGEKLFT